MSLYFNIKYDTYTPKTSQLIHTKIFKLFYFLFSMHFIVVDDVTIIYGHRVKWHPDLIYVSIHDNLNKFDINMSMECYMLSVCGFHCSIHLTFCNFF